MESSSEPDSAASVVSGAGDTGTAGSPISGAETGGGHPEPEVAREPLQGPQIPATCGPAHRLRPDIAAALMWGPRGTYALTAERLIGLVGDSELVLVVTSAWISPQGWGLCAVTTDRVLYVPNASTEDSFAQTISSMLWLLDADVSNGHGDRKGNLVDLERNIVVWFESLASVEAVNTTIRWAVRVHTNDQPGYDKAETDNVLEEFSRFEALRRAHETGALDNDSMRQALSKMFPPHQSSPPDH